MPQKRKFPVDGKEMDGVEIGFEPTREAWNEYELVDGGRIRIRLTVVRVFQLLDDKGQPAHNPIGERMLIVESNNQLVVQE